MTDRCFVMYRCFDAAGRLIYVGSSSSWTRRLSEHRRQAWWWSLSVRTVTEAHPTLESARAAEAVAIQEEQPAFNWRDAGRPWLARRDGWTAADHEMHRDWHESRGLRPPALETFNRAAWRHIA